MSAEARQWARSVRNLERSDRLVLYNLADECRRGQCRVWKAGDGAGGPGGVGAIAIEEELDRRTVQRALRRLEERKLVSIENAGGGFRITTTYVLNMHDNSGVMPLFAESETAAFTTPNSGMVSRNSGVVSRNSGVVPPSPVIPKSTGKGTGSQNRASVALERVPVEVVPASTPNGVGESDPPHFRDFWKLYPRKSARGEAVKAFRRAVKKDQVDLIASGLAMWAEHWEAEDTEERYIPYPATWLNQARYLDTPPTRRQSQTEREIARFLAAHEDRP
jgi:hypothetical protein